MSPVRNWIVAPLLVSSVLAACSDGDRATRRMSRGDALSEPERVKAFSTTLVNDGSLPGDFEDFGGSGKALFFSMNFGGLFLTDGTAAGTQLLRDLEPLLWPSATLPPIVVLGDKAYWFQAQALWVTDGTPSGTSRVVGLSTTGGGFLGNLVAYGGSLYFRHNDQFMKSDGTPEGTVSFGSLSPAGRMVEAMGFLYFPCLFPGAGAGYELCVTDGTLVGTQLAVDVVPGSGSSFPDPIGELNGLLLFSASTDSANTRRGLYATDGTQAGTVQLLAPPATGPAVFKDEEMVVSGSFGFIRCFTTATGTELCRTDGTVAGTEVIDIVPGTGSSFIAYMVPFGSGVVFRHCTSSTGCELWLTTGTAQGTKLVKDLRTGTASGLDNESRPIQLGGEVYFAASDGSAAGQGLWKSDGTEAGTVLVKSILAPSTRGALVLGGRLLFRADDGVHGEEPWVSDGTTAGTGLLKDLLPAAHQIKASEGVASADSLLLSVKPPVGKYSLWLSDGTPEGTGILQESSSSDFPYLHRFGDKLGFFAGTPAWLWLTDGTVAGTVKVIEARPSSNDLVVSQTHIFFAGLLGGNSALWHSDGTTAGSGPASPQVKNARRLGLSNNSVFLTGLAGGQGNELWRSDGTKTEVVRDINPGSDSSEPDHFAPLGTKTVFSANDGTSGREPWITDGTWSGTNRIIDLRPGSAGSSPQGFFNLNGEVLFWATSALSLPGLWKTSGTEASTVQLKQLSQANAPFVQWGDHAFFAATDEAGSELWRTDGTVAGTVRVADLYPGPHSSFPRDLRLLSPTGPLVFSAEEPTTGRELWMLASPGAGPVQISDIASGPASSNPRLPMTRRLALYFVANDGTGDALYKMSGLIPDVTAPALSCPSNVQMEAPDEGGVVVEFDPPVAKDDSETAPVVTISHVSGSVFPVGQTVVNVTATDGVGNASSCTFTVHVSFTPPPMPPAEEPDAGVQVPEPEARPPPPEPEPIEPSCGCASSSPGALVSSVLMALIGARLLRARRRA